MHRFDAESGAPLRSHLKKHNAALIWGGSIMILQNKNGRNSFTF
jgi:hypothetical protein